MGAIQALFTPTERRTLRFSVPEAQWKLALGVLGITLGFGILFVLNAYAAFASLTAVVLEIAGSPPRLKPSMIGFSAKPRFAVISS